MKKKIITTLFIILLFLSNIIHVSGMITSKDYYSNNKKINIDTNKTNFFIFDSEICYGIIIPYKDDSNTPYTSIQISIANYVNDLLRLDVFIYWAEEDFNVLSGYISDDSVTNRFFNKGSFLIPFTGNKTKDNLILCITNDYFNGSEIESNYKIEIIFLLEQIEIKVLPLNYAKIAYFFGTIIHPWMLLYYFDLLQMGGFLDNKLYLEDEIPNNLTNDNFNLFIWPGGDPSADISGLIDTALHLKTSIAIRDFVNNGGGYIGSCYGARTASSGMILPFFLLQHYFRKIPATLFLSLIPSIFFETFYSGIATIKLNPNNPVNYGLGETIKTWHMGPGPFFIWTAPKVKKIGVFQDVEIQWIENNYKNVSPIILELWKRAIIGSSSWISSEFGKGKSVVFCDHPELPIPYKKDKVIHNSVFYTTADQQKKISFEKYISLSKIKEIFQKSQHIELEYNDFEFTDIRNELDFLINQSKQINLLDKNRLHLIKELFLENKVNREGLKLNTVYDDSFHRMLFYFSESLYKIEKIYNTTKNYDDLKSNILKWKEDILNEIRKCKKLMDEIIIFHSDLDEKLSVFKDTEFERSYVSNLVTNLDRLFKNGYSRIMQLWQLTVKKYREIWYKFELKIVNDRTYDFSQTIDKIGYEKNIKYIDNSTLYVDIDALVGGDGSCEYPYRQIQDAIDSANNGDTIIVYEGIYYEQPIIHKSVKIKGIDKNNTIIDANEKPHHVIISTAPNVELSGFTVRNSSLEGNSGGINVYSYNNTIKDNIFTDNGFGIGMYPNGENNKFIENIIEYNRYVGIFIDEPKTKNNVVKGNIIKNNSMYGLYLVNASVEISDNMFINNGINIFSDGISFTPIVMNNMINNKELFFIKNLKNIKIPSEVGQIILMNCSDILINNKIIYNTEIGISLIDSSNITVEDCIFQQNKMSIFCKNSENIKINNCLIENNSWSGIYLQNSDYNNIKKNEITNNDDGIIIYQSNESDITYNDITNNQVGIFICSDSHNNISSNFYYGNDIDIYDKKNP